VQCPACSHVNRDGAKFCEECGSPLTVARSADDALPPSIGAGRYTPKQLLGEGSRKRVYLSLDERLGREVAVAVVKTDGLDQAGRVRIAREARATARLGDHPRIVTVHDVGEEADGTPFIVSQLMAGGTLAERLSAAPEGRLPVDDALRIAEDVASALTHAHAIGVVHRDVKPANIWLASDGAAHLGDFGLAVAVDASRITSEGMVVGTVAYLAPEQAMGREPDPRSDLYSLGAVLYEMLAGRPPYLGDDAVTVISQHLNATPVAPSWHNRDVDAELDALVLRLLARDPAERPPTADATIGELHAIATTRRAPPQEAVPRPTDATARPDLRRAEWGRFVGRAAELAQLRAALDDTTKGHGRVVMVVGEPGIGKTRLVEELATHAAVGGATVLWGHSYEGEVGVPYLPFVEAFRSYVRSRDDAELASWSSAGLPEVATLVPSLHERFPELPELPQLEGDAERLRLFEGVGAFLRAAAAEQPVVLVLDDLHWADKPSLLLLQHLARSMRDARLLLVGTYRDVELERAHPLAEAIAALRRGQLYERLLLRGFERDEVKAFIEVVGGQETPDQFADLVFRETEGNPFFVAEILRHLADSGAIHREDGAWVGTPETVASHLPEGVREVIGRRLDTLSDRCNEMLTVAAAMPGGFTIDVVGDVTGFDEDTMLDLLDESLAAQVVRERRDQSGVYEFNHALIRQTLYGELSTPRRVRMHRRVTDALEGRYADSIESHLPELAYHASEAAPGGDVEKAVEYAVRAAARAMDQAAYEEAARYRLLALGSLEHASGDSRRRRGDLLVDLAKARHRAGEQEAAQADLRDAAALARELDDPDLLGRAAAEYLGVGYVQASIVDESHDAVFEEAETVLRAVDSTPEREALLAQVLTRHSAYVFFTDPERSLALLDEAAERARRSGDRRLQLRTRSIARGGRFARVTLRDDLLEMLADARECDDVESELSALTSLVLDALYSADRDELDRRVAEHSAAADRSRVPTYVVNAISLTALLAALDGRFDDAIALANDMRDRARALENRVMLANVGVLLLPVYREQGRLAELEPATRRIATAATAVPSWKAGYAWLLAETGRLDDARDVLLGLLDDPLAERDDVIRRYLRCALAETAVRTGPPSAIESTAARVADEDDGGSVILGNLAYHGCVDRYLGLVALALARPDEAVTRHESAITAHEAMRSPPWVTRSRYDLARALIARGASGDGERAGRLLNEAVETATELGMTRLLEEALAVKLELQGVPTGSSPLASIDVVTASVTFDRPDLGAHAADDGQVTLCFSDVVDYTVMTERLGDARTHEILRSHNDLLRRELVAHGGTEVKSEGDGFMLAFSDSAQAVRFAIAFRDAVDEHSWPADAGRIRVHVAIHRGEVIQDADDFFGRTVIIGARLAGLAGPGEVLVTDAVREAAPDVAMYGDPREVELKGLRGRYRAHPVAGA
jgi:class 3 adenylate cyclase